MFTFPIYMLTYIPIAFVAMFKKVEWKPIAHGSRTANRFAGLRLKQSFKIAPSVFIFLYLLGF